MIKLNLENLKFEASLREIIKQTFPYDHIKICHDNFGEGRFIKCIVKDNIMIIMYSENGKLIFREQKEIDFKRMNHNQIYDDFDDVVKLSLKIFCFEVFSKFTKTNLPWGILTGVKPTKIAHTLLNKSFSKNLAEKHIKNYFLVNDKKINLLMEIAEKEKKILEPFNESFGALYIGIPFCPSKCSYCSFTSEPLKNREIVKRYLKSLYLNLKKIKNRIDNLNYKIATIYVGGGTPTSIDDELFEELIQYLNVNFYSDFLAEFTLEAGRVDTITRSKLEIMKKNKITRISINPQSMNNKVLRNVSRNHTAEEVILKFRLARELGFDNINMDLIAGLPGESVSDFKHSIHEIIKLNPESVTIHNLAIKNGTELSNSTSNIKTSKNMNIKLDTSNRKLTVNNKIDKINQINGNKFLSSDDLNKMLDFAYGRLEEIGLKPYYMYRQKNMVGNLENVGFSKYGNECIYNTFMISDSYNIFSAGAAAVTKRIIRGNDCVKREFNPKDVSTYIEKYDA